MLLEKVSLPFHACVKLTGSMTVYVDPYGLKEDSHDADLILVTHDHYDHLSPEDIARVRKESTVLVLPASSKGQIGTAGFSSVQAWTLTPGESCRVGGVEVTAVAAYNKGKPFHPKANGWLGYVVELDGVRYYIAGDTDDIPEARAVRCDVALVPVGGTYTMDAQAAAELVNAIAPKAAVPTHYGSVVGGEEDAERFCALLDDSIEGAILMGK